MSLIKLCAPFDAHVHLRQGSLAGLVVPHVKRGGIKTAYVMPNTVPPLATPTEAVDYLRKLQTLDPETLFLPTMYLTTQLTPELIKEAKEKGIVGVKSYPRGVTTNSDGGVGMEGYSVYDSVFAEMERQGLVLNLHGEVPSDVDAEHGHGACVLDAEIRFLPHLKEIARKFPNLKIVLEHCTTSEAVDCVKSLPDHVSATITPHHLSLTIDGAVSTSLGFCKPLAKYPKDREALRQVIRDGNAKFFLGSDSAPHPTSTKLPVFKTATNADGQEEHILPSPCAAGIYTSANLVPLTATIFEQSGIPLERLEGFVSTFGRKFYGLEAKPEQSIVIKRVENALVEKAFPYVTDNGDQEFVIPFLAGKAIGWEIVDEA